MIWKTEGYLWRGGRGGGGDSCHLFCFCSRPSKKSGSVNAVQFFEAPGGGRGVGVGGGFGLFTFPLVALIIITSRSPRNIYIYMLFVEAGKNNSVLLLSCISRP